VQLLNIYLLLHESRIIAPLNSYLTMKNIYTKPGLWTVILAMVVSTSIAQPLTEPFNITWNFSGIKSGVSSSTNFLAQDASFAPQVLNQGYVAVDTDNQAIIAQNWPDLLDPNFYLQFEFTPLVFKFDLNTISTRLKRSANGPRQFTVSLTLTKYNTFDDSVTYNVGAFSLPTENFTTVNINAATYLAQHSTYKIRIYAYGATSVYEDLIFDYVQVNGDRTNTILPVKLVYFDAASAGNRIDLRWETAWERNSKEFIIQRSSDLNEFGDIGRVAAAGDSEGRRQYIFSDEQPLIGTNYYRLRSVDRDDTYEYSKPVDAIYRPEQPTILVGPNPVTDNVIRIRTFGVPNESLRLNTINGQSLPVRLNITGVNEVEMRPLLPLASGIYLLTGNQESSNPLTIKVLVK
jgi:hypothetical protein